MRGGIRRWGGESREKDSRSGWVDGLKDKKTDECGAFWQF